MKNLLPLFLLVISTSLSAQEERANYTVFNPTKMPKDFFIVTNSGVLNTPIGLKVGFLSNPGLYIGLRHGLGEVYHSDTDLTTSGTNLVSITGGLSFPLLIKNDFSLIAQVGAGYGQWWRYRWERWIDSGYEIEAGLLIRKKNFLFNITGNMLDNVKTYPTGDICVGVGFVMNNCK
jgi:hypothetical protein